ncbi:MAG: hypothetical protein RIE32_09815 [Phycisphaerales bacterium]
MPRLVARTPTASIAAVLTTLAPAAALAQPEVPDGFTIRRIAPLLDGEPPRMEAIQDPDGFGTGVVTATLSDGVTTFRLVSPSGTISVLGTTLVDGGTFVSRVAFDRAGIFDSPLNATIVSGSEPRPFGNTTRFVTIDRDGTVRERWLEGASSDQTAYNFTITNGQAGNPVGAVLLDADATNGTKLARMDTGYAVSVVDPDSVPASRSDTDVVGMQVDLSGRYGGGVLLADTDNTDSRTAIYELRDVDGGGSYRAIYGPVSWSLRRYGDLALATDGLLAGPSGGLLYVTETLTDEVQTVEPDGTHTTWATGFTDIDALSISPDGQSMYVSDNFGVWLIRQSGIEPGPVVIETSPSVPARSTLTGAPVTSLRIIFNEPVSFDDADVTIIDGDGNPVAFDASGSGSQFMLIGLGAPLDGDAYTVTIADSVRSIATGEALDGDRDGVAGGDAQLIFAHACQADFDGDGELTIFDFLAFQNAFDAGCP